MKKVVVGLLLAAICCVTVFAGGRQDSGTGAGTETKKVISFYTWWADAERTTSEYLIADYEAAHPNVKVEQNYIAYNDYLPKINTMIASGASPDVFQLNEYLVKEWGEKNVIDDQAPFYKAAGIEPEKYFVASDTYKAGDKLWAISYGNTIIHLFYNKNLFKAAGITPPPESAANPWTWDQYVAAAKKLTKDSRGRTPADAGFDYNNLAQYGTVMPTSWIYVLPLLNTANSGFASPDGRSLLISKTDGVNAIQKIANLALMDKVAPTVAMSQSTAFSSLSALLMNDQLGMFIGGTFQFPDFQNEKYDVGIAQIPSFSGKGSNISLPGAHVIKKGASQEAFELAAFLADYNNWVKVSKKYNIGINQLPSTRSTYDDPALNKAWVEQFDATMARVAGDALANAVRPSESINLKNFSEIVDQTISPVLDRVWLGSVSAKEGLEPLEKTLSGKLIGVWQ